MRDGLNLGVWLLCDLSCLLVSVSTLRGALLARLLMAKGTVTLSLHCRL